MEIYHNPRCAKSRQTLELLQNKGIDPDIRLYLNDPPSIKELSSIIKKLGLKPLELIRKNEKIYKEQFKGQDLSDREWIKVMVEHPKLIERPIVISGDTARIGRPPESILEII